MAEDKTAVSSATGKSVKRYVVTGALVRFVTMTQQGRAVVDFHQGALVPADATPESIAHHLSRGLIEEVRVPAVDEQAEGSADVLTDKELREAAKSGDSGSLSDAALSDAGTPGRVSDKARRAQEEADEAAIKADPSPHVERKSRAKAEPGSSGTPVPPTTPAPVNPNEK